MHEIKRNSHWNFRCWWLLIHLPSLTVGTNYWFSTWSLRVMTRWLQGVLLGAPEHKPFVLFDKTRCHHLKDLDWFLDSHWSTSLPVYRWWQIWTTHYSHWLIPRQKIHSICKCNQWIGLYSNHSTRRHGWFARKWSQGVGLLLLPATPRK